MPACKLLKTDSEGFILNKSKPENIQPLWAKPVQEVLEAHQKRFTSNLHSFYLRGSIPQGLAMENISDIDSIAIIRGTVTPDFHWIAKLRKVIKSRYSFVKDIDCQFFPYPEILNHHSLLSCRFNLRHLSICLHGEDLSQSIKAFKPNRQLGFYLHGNIIEVLENAKRQFIKDPASSQLTCIWIMKRLIRTGFALVMERERAYTRDLTTCYEVFSKYYPKQKSMMAQALDLAIYPIDDLKKISAVIDPLGDWLIQEARKVFSGNSLGL